MPRASNGISDIERLFNNVVKNGYCIGCGACASVADSPIRMQLDEYGRFCAAFDLSRHNVATQINFQVVCPFLRRLAGKVKRRLRRLLEER